ncbi:MAG: hypothetical protein V9E94_20340, partial [Microthrixaceae bacterium]
RACMRSTTGGAIIVVTIQTVPFALEAIRESKALAGKRFAVIIDEAHSSQTGESANKLRQTLSGKGLEDVADEEGTVGVDDLVRLELEGRGALPNAVVSSPSPPRRRARRWNCSASVTDRRAVSVRAVPPLLDAARPSRRASSSTCWRTTRPTRRYYRLVARPSQDYDSETCRQAKATKAMRQVRDAAPIRTSSQKAAIIVEHFRTHVARACSAATPRRWWSPILASPCRALQARRCEQATSPSVTLDGRAPRLVAFSAVTVDDPEAVGTPSQAFTEHCDER